jgi:hypothetical protein
MGRLVRTRSPQRSPGPLDWAFAKRRRNCPCQVAGIPVSHGSSDVDARCPESSPSASVTQADPALEDAAVEPDAVNDSCRPVLRLEILELRKDVVVAGQQHAAPMLGAGDEDFGTRDGGAGLRQADPEIPIAQLKEPLIEASEPPNEIRPRDHIRRAAPKYVPSEERLGKESGIRGGERVAPCAVLRDSCRSPVSEGGALRIGSVDLDAELARRPEVVVIEKRDPRALCDRDAGVARRRDAARIVVAEQSKSRVDQRRENVRRSVRGSIVHNDHLDVYILLAER